MSSVYVKATFLYEFDLKSDSSKYFSTLSTSYIYKFYISAKYCQKVNFELTKSDSSSMSSQSLTIYEYSNRYLTTQLRKTNSYLSYSYSTSSYSTTYNVSNSSSTYLAFEIQPNNQMSSVYIKVSVKSPINEFDLTSGSTKYFSTLSTSYKYKFHIYAQTVDIKITKSDSSSNSPHYFTIYEYSSRYSANELWKTCYSLSYNYSTNSYSTFFL